MKKNDIEEAVLSPEDSAKVRKDWAKPTGEAETARQLHKFFLNAKPSMAQHRYDFVGVRGAIDVKSMGRQIKSNATFWYDKKVPKITLVAGGKLMEVSLIGRKDSNGFLTKFSIKPVKVFRDKSTFAYLHGREYVPEEYEEDRIDEKYLARVGGKMVIVCETVDQANSVLEEAHRKLLKSEIVESFSPSDVVYPYSEWEDRAIEEDTMQNNKVKLKSLVNEVRDDYPIYHGSYTSAIEAAKEYAKRKGWYIDPEEAADVIGLQSHRPKDGKTTKVSLPVYKNEAESYKRPKKALQIQVYNRGVNGNTYELNCYIS